MHMVNELLKKGEVEYSINERMRELLYRETSNSTIGNLNTDSCFHAS